MHWRRVTPREWALAVLHAWFGPPAAASSSSIRLTGFQQAAFSRIEQIIEVRGGALLADAVGLGKTFVALAVIERTLCQNGEVVVVLPAPLRAHWQQHLRRLPKRLRTAPRLVTHTALSMGRVPAIDPRLIVVDEAHAFRNPRTRRYQALARLAARSRVLLLTATPINNKLIDLYHQIRLFAADDAFRDLGIVDLHRIWTAASEDSLAQRAVQQVIEAVVVRRTRDLVDAPEQQLRFARREPPQTVCYDLVSTYGPAWSRLYRALAELSFACVAGAARRGPAELMRLQLLKRLESSVVAFARSVRRLAELSELLQAALAKDCWIEPAALLSLVRDGELGTQLPLEQLLTGSPPRDLDTAALQSVLRADLELLRSCQQTLLSPLARLDPKLAALESLLHDLGPQVIVFTQFRDTARHLWSRLHKRNRVGLIHGNEARLGAQRAGRTTVIECFAPRASGARKPSARLRLDVLITTDVLSEGLNLQDAHTVVNYDIPWNPVTLMQRMGRVDRLGSLHESVRLYNFLPDRGLDAWLGLIDRVQNKLQVIQRTLGADASVLPLPEEVSPRAALKLALGVAPRDHDAFQQHQTTESLRACWQKESQVQPTAGPVVSRLAGNPEGPEGWLFAYTDDRHLRFAFIDATARVKEDPQLAGTVLHRALAAQEGVPSQPIGPPPWPQVAAWLDSQRKTRGISDSTRNITPEAGAATLLLKSLEQTPRAALVQRADRLLRVLAQPLSAGAAANLNQLLQSVSADIEPLELVARLESALAESAPAEYRARFQPVACLRISASV